MSAVDLMALRCIEAGHKLSSSTKVYSRLIDEGLIEAIPWGQGVHLTEAGKCILASYTKATP